MVAPSLTIVILSLPEDGLEAQILLVRHLCTCSRQAKHRRSKSRGPFLRVFNSTDIAECAAHFQVWIPVPSTGMTKFVGMTNCSLILCLFSAGPSGPPSAHRLALRLAVSACLATEGMTYCSPVPSRRWFDFFFGSNLAHPFGLRAI